MKMKVHADGEQDSLPLILRGKTDHDPIPIPPGGTGGRRGGGVWEVSPTWTWVLLNPQVCWTTWTVDPPPPTTDLSLPADHYELLTLPPHPRTVDPPEY